MEICKDSWFYAFLNSIGYFLTALSFDNFLITLSNFGIEISKSRKTISVIQLILMGIIQLVTGIQLAKKKKIGWWLANFYYSFMVIKYALLVYQFLPYSDLLGNTILKWNFKIIFSLFVVWFLFKEKTLRLFFGENSRKFEFFLVMLGFTLAFFFAFYFAGSL